MTLETLPTNGLAQDLLLGNPAALWWTVAAIAAGLLVLLAVMQRYRARRRFATSERLEECFGRATFFSRHPRITALTSALVTTISFMLLTLALVDIRWGKTQQEVPQSGIEVLFLLDVSRSMLAQDVTPNRLARAKQMIRDMVQRMAGDRVGLILFAGESRQTIPLTNHYEDFSQMLEEAGPHSLRRGGSRLGDAIATASRGFLEKTSAQRVLVVLTDGEDQESDPVQTAKRLHEEEQLVVFTIGLGDMQSGARIPDVDLDRPQHDPGRYVKYQGQPVWSKMNGEILSQVASVTGGVYVPAGTKHVDMGAIYDRYIAGMPTTQFESAKVNAYVARFQWFAVPALLLLLLEFASKLSWQKTHPHDWKASARNLAILLACAVAAPTMANAQSPSTRQITASYNQGVELYRQGDFTAAAEKFEHASASPDNSVAASARYNRATALYALTVQSIAASPQPEAAPPDTQQWQATLRQAIDSFRSALQIKPQWDDARANLEKAIRLLQQLEQQQQQQQQNQQNQESQNQDQAGEQDDSQSSRPQDPQMDESQSEQSDSEQPESEQPESQESDSDSSSAENSPENADQPAQPQEAGEDTSDSADGDSADVDSAEDESAADNAPEDGSTGTSEPREPMSDTSSPDADAPDPDGSDEQPPTQPEDVSGELSSEANDPPAEAAESDSELGDAAFTEIPDDRSMTAEEAMKMLQAVRDRDMIRRFRLQQLQQSRQIPVDKDW